MMMSKAKNWRYLLGIIKDRSSAFKSSLLIRRNASVVVAVIRATSHKPSNPPSDDHIATVFYYGARSQFAAEACIEALVDRLHCTHNASVALKCLFILHKISLQGSSILSDQFSFCPSYGGHNFLNLSTFSDNFDGKTMEMSSWVRWYAGVLEQNMIVSRQLGYLLSTKLTNLQVEEILRNSAPLQYSAVAGASFIRPLFYKAEMKFVEIKTSDLLREIDVLVDFVEQVCDNPSSLYLQKKDLVYDVVRLVGENYRLVQYEIISRIKEFNNRILNELDLEDLTQSFKALKRLENCRDGLLLLFVNRHRHDAFWELISQTKKKLSIEKEKREEQRLAVRGDSRKLAGTEQFLRLMSGSGWTGFV